MRPENQQPSQPTSDGPQWDQYSSVLDEAIAKLRPQDRDAVVLRYLRGRSLRDVGAALGVGEDAARKRVDRSVQLLRKTLSAKTAVPAAAVLVMHLTTRGVQAAPAALVQNITGAAATGTLASSTLKAILMTTKIKLALTTGAVLAALVLGVAAVKVIGYVATGNTPTAPPREQLADIPSQDSSPPIANPPANRIRTPASQYWNGYPTRAPFTAVRWSGQTPQVQVGANWYELTAIDSIPIDQIISFDQSLPQGAGLDYKKHFQEDLVELLTRMGHEPGPTVALSVTDPDTGKDQVLQNIPMTEDNRYTMLAAARPPGSPLPPRPMAAPASTQPGPLAPADVHTAPFTAVRFAGDTPQVQVNQTWYELVAIDAVPADQIVQFAKTNYPSGNATFPLWQKRIGEDLVEVLTKLDHAPNNVVSLDLRKLDTGESINLPAVPMTDTNRQAILQSNLKDHPFSAPAGPATRETATDSPPPTP